MDKLAITLFLLLTCSSILTFGQSDHKLDSLQHLWEDTDLPEEDRLEAVMQAALYLWYPKVDILKGHEMAQKIKDIDQGELNPKYQSIYQLSRGWQLRKNDFAKSLDTISYSLTLANEADFQLGVALGYKHMGWTNWHFRSFAPQEI